MLNKPLLTILLAFTAITPSLANGNMTTTEGKRYVGINYGISIPNKFKYDEILEDKRPKNSQLFGISLGYKWDDNIRLELAYNHFHNYKYSSSDTLPVDGKVKLSGQSNRFNQKLKADALFANFYWDINKFDKLVPYIGFGLGVSRNDSGTLYHTMKQDNKEDIRDISNKGKKKTQFAWNVGAGITYQLNEKIDLNLIDYKYYNLGQFSTRPDSDGDSMKARLKAHTVTVGVKIKF